MTALLNAAIPLVALLGTLVCSAAAPAEPPPPPATPLSLSSFGDPRPISPHLFGATLNPFMEKFVGNAKRIAVLKPMGIGLTRFPSGTQANYHNWRTGLPSITLLPNSSNEIRAWQHVADKIAENNPEGVSAESYADFSRELGAEMILVPNLETSTPEEQAAWFRALQLKNDVPTRIELGNAFAFAMKLDPSVVAKWPDEPTAMKVMRRYNGALNSLYPPGTKVAVQSSASAYDPLPYGTSPLYERLRKWDEALKPEPWFQAVTLHLYPRAAEFLEAGISGPALFKGMMGRADQGVQDVLRYLEKHLPGKEIWITEWNPRGPGRLQDQDDPVPPAMLLQLTARMALTFLRHPAVTAALFYRVDFKEGIGYQMFIEDKGEISATAPMQALGWLNVAANSSTSFQRMTEPGAVSIPSGGARLEGYNEIEAGLFKGPAGMTLILQNVSATPRLLDARKLFGKTPLSATAVSETNFKDPYQWPARILNLPVNGVITVPPYSVTRVLWK